MLLLQVLSTKAGSVASLNHKLLHFKGHFQAAPERLIILVEVPRLGYSLHCEDLNAAKKEANSVQKSKIKAIYSHILLMYSACIVEKVKLFSFAFL